MRRSDCAIRRKDSRSGGPQSRRVRGEARKIAFDKTRRRAGRAGAARSARRAEADGSFEVSLTEAEKARWSLKESLRPGLEALKKFWAPFLLIQLGAAGLVLAYYFVPSVQAFAEGIVDLRERLGLLFSALGGFLAGGVVPEIAKVLTGKVRKFDGKWLRDAAFGGFIYLVVAVEVDLFYQLQAVLFGTGVDPMTVLIKTTVDMGLFSPLLCMP